MCAPTLSLALSEELNAAAQVPMDAFLLQLLPLRSFAEVVLQQDLREFNAYPQLALFSLRILAGLMNVSPSPFALEMLFMNFTVICYVPIPFHILMLQIKDTRCTNNGHYCAVLNNVVKCLL